MNDAAKRHAGLQQAIKGTGLENENSVRGTDVPGKGFQVEAASPDEDGWTRYGPPASPRERPPERCERGYEQPPGTVAPAALERRAGTRHR